MSATPAELYRYAVGRLSRREYARRELGRKLELRCDDEAAVASVLDELEEKNYLSDERFVASYAKERVRRGYGPLKITYEMKQRGAMEDCVRDWLAAEKGRWAGRARQARERRFGAKPPGEYKERMRQMNYLSQRGFSAEDIRAAFSKKKEE